MQDERWRHDTDLQSARRRRSAEAAPDLEASATLSGSHVRTPFTSCGVNGVHIHIHIHIHILRSSVPTRYLNYWDVLLFRPNQLEVVGFKRKNGLGIAFVIEKLHFVAFRRLNKTHNNRTFIFYSALKSRTVPSMFPLFANLLFRRHLSPGGHLKVDIPCSC